MQDNSRDGAPNDGVPTDGVPDARAAARTNLFLAATLYSAAGAHPVKIRDLSALGARIEGERVPEAGSTMTLARGSLSVLGLVAWRSESRCGLQFASSVSVRDWMGNPVNREQQRVDHVVGLVKASAVPLAIPTPRATETADDLAQDLRRVACLLEHLGDELASDLVVAANYGVKLQNLDIAVQTLSALAETIRTVDPEPASNMARLDELRKSCTEALRVSR